MAARLPFPVRRTHEQTLTAQSVQCRNGKEVKENICTKVVNAVRGDIENGEDSALFKALGYVPKSERKSRMAALKKAA
jgi:hypothetical protein